MVYVWDVQPEDICHTCWHGRSEEKVGELEQRGFFRSGGAINFESKMIINSIGKKYHEENLRILMYIL